jgi:hypothetical protein
MPKYKLVKKDFHFTIEAKNKKDAIKVLTGRANIERWDKLSDGKFFKQEDIAPFVRRDR